MTLTQLHGPTWSRNPMANPSLCRRSRRVRGGAGRACDSSGPCGSPEESPDGSTTSHTRKIAPLLGLVQTGLPRRAALGLLQTLTLPARGGTRQSRARHRRPVQGKRYGGCGLYAGMTAVRMGGMKYDSPGQANFGAREIAALVSQYRASALGLKRFAQEQGISYGRLHYWVYHQHRSRASAFRPKCSETAAPVFQEVKLGALPAASTGWAAEVSLPAGMAIRFSTAAEPGWMGSVVQALRGLC